MDEKDLELTQTKERLAYLTADFENFRRRTEKDRAQWMQIAQSEVLKKLIAIADDFDRAFRDLNVQEQSNQLLGFELIHKALKKLLTSYGVEEMLDTTTFDPEKHEAIMHVPDTGKEPGTIIDVLQKGYLHKGSVLRPAHVSVAQ